MKFNDLIKHILNEKTYEYDGLIAYFKYLEFPYMVEGRVDYEIGEMDWDNWNVEVWDIYDRIEKQTYPKNMGKKIEFPDEGIIAAAKLALRNEANEKGTDAGHFEEPEKEKEFNWEDLDDKGD